MPPYGSRIRRARREIVAVIVLLLNPLIVKGKS